jgi:hypothetical protein
MNEVKLNNYELTSSQWIQSLFISEYGLRHLEQSCENGKSQWGHRVVGIIQLFPVIGLIATAIEALVFHLSTKKPYLEDLSSYAWYFRSNQVGNVGPVNLEIAKRYIEKLNQNHPYVKFNPLRLKDQMSLGSCTAQSFKLLNNYFKLKYQHISDIEGEIRRFQKVKNCSEKTRYKQAAFNTIELIQHEDCKNTSKAKIEGLIAGKFNLGIALNGFDLETLTQSEFEKILKSLPEGTFLFRAIKPDDNHKMEAWGHSLIYINEDPISLFYDPNFGALDLKKSNPAKAIYDCLKFNREYYKLSELSIYHLSPNDHLVNSLKSFAP